MTDAPEPVLTGNAVLTEDQQQRLQRLSPEAYRRWRDAMQPEE